MKTRIQRLLATLLLRQTLVGIGAALLVGGWGMTKYADAQVAVVSSLGTAVHLNTWANGRVARNWIISPTRTTYKNGVLCMAFGAGLIGFGLSRKDKELR